ncbi:MAG: transketolase family protein [Clostridia bacterium]|nr:transketolase family protein [Clostridia bacterium]
MVKLSDTHEPDSVEMRAAYCDALIDAAEKDSRIVSINCDLSSSCGTVRFAERFPTRSFNFGIQEANGCCAAAGMSAAGLVPFFHSFAIFSSRRICDQLFMSCAYAGLNVKVIGCDAGVSATYNGGTHMAFEDIGILRSIPEITIMEPSDAVMMKSLVTHMAETYGVFYMRTPRKEAERIYADGASFTVGKAAVLREGTDVTLIASGMTVIEALRAADLLACEGISARVADMFTVKPIDAECILDSADKTGAIVTVENHNIIGGLGSAVAEVLAEHRLGPLVRVGVKDEFGEVGQLSDLKKRFGLTAEDICAAARQALTRKQ